MSYQIIPIERVLPIQQDAREAFEMNHKPTDCPYFVGTFESDVWLAEYERYLNEQECLTE